MVGVLEGAWGLVGASALEGALGMVVGKEGEGSGVQKGMGVH